MAIPVRQRLFALVTGAVVCSFLCAPLSATTLLALIDRKHHRVVLAADSLLRFSTSRPPEQTCKIVAQPQCVFGMAGLFEKQYPVFRLRDLAEQACSVPQDLHQRADAFLEVAQRPVIEVARYLRDNEPEFYRGLTSTHGGELVMVLFAGTDRGNLVIYARGYKLDSNGAVVPVSTDILENTGGIGFFAGANLAIADYMKTHKKWPKMDAVAAAKKFVEVEEQAHPEWVGPPVSIVTVNKLDEQKWIEPGECSAASAKTPSSAVNH